MGKEKIYNTSLNRAVKEHLAEALANPQRKGKLLRYVQDVGNTIRSTYKIGNYLDYEDIPDPYTLRIANNLMNKKKTIYVSKFVEYGHRFNYFMSGSAWKLLEPKYVQPTFTMTKLYNILKNDFEEQ